jgi:hypothetical protein
VVSFLKFFHGVIDTFHLPHSQLATWRTTFALGMRLKARILHISTASKMIRLTLLKNLLEYHLPTTLPMLGSVYEDVKVIRPDPNIGALVSVPMSPTAQLGFIHISNLEPKAGATTVASSIGKDYPAGTVLKAKVIGYRYAAFRLEPSVSDLLRFGSGCDLRLVLLVVRSTLSKQQRKKR